jgi:hypothetical protein
MSNTMTFWVNTITGERVDRRTLDLMRSQARRLYEANTAIFEDELDALGALGVVSDFALESELQAA